MSDKSDKNELDLPTLDLNTSLNILIQGVQIAQKAGVYNFQDSASIYQAIASIQSLAKESEERQKQQQAKVASAAKAVDTKSSVEIVPDVKVV